MANPKRGANSCSNIMSMNGNYFPRKGKIDVEQSCLSKFPDFRESTKSDGNLTLLDGTFALSGLCPLNFSAAESILSITATDCWALLAPYMANVVCCPQFDATLVILIGHSSIYSQPLALNLTDAKHCLSDVEQVLEGQGASENLHEICSMYPSNLTEASCPIVDVKEMDSTVDSSRLLAACEKIDFVDECCNQVCQNPISDAAEKIALKNYSMASSNGDRVLAENSIMINDCKSIVLRWLASKLDPSSANRFLRGLSCCNINKVSE
ncbi:unnamed protein product [Ilex paraguariensis]|uniref:SPARK domain-containing protein n=1 Tax=Ilex paraguariensis TaxID=185542 RepID=A0ABC8SSY7_9AQUA